MGRKINFICVGCGIEKTAYNTYGKYCSNKCQQDHKYRETISQWFAGASGMKVGNRLISAIRRWCLEEAKHQCSKCGWNQINSVTGKSPLEIDHIDGNSENCRPENLRVLCPNCHSLTPTWKALNAGKGSKKRLYYSKLIK